MLPQVRLIKRSLCRNYQTIFHELQARGLIHSHTAPLESLPLKGSVYVGFDPTAPSLHVGNLLQISVLHRLGKAGLSPIALVGGATGLIGDPSGRATERELLTKETINQNLNGLLDNLNSICKDVNLKVFNNIDWYNNMGMLEYLRDVGKHFRVNKMLERDAVKSRIENEQEGISFLEFSYQTLQAYDFYYLYKTNNCVIQFGGSDQWGNIVGGIEYIRKQLNAQSYGFTIPLLTDSEGNKIGKSTHTGTVWLSQQKTSAYDFYQFWFNRPDSEMEKLLKAYSFKTIPEINEILENHKKNPDLRLAQKELASEITKYVHGDSGLSRALASTKIFFGQDVFKNLSASDFIKAFEDTNRLTKVTEEQVLEKNAFESILLCKSLTTSKSNLRRLFGDGGVYFNDQRINADYKITKNDLLDGMIVVFRTGKKDYHILNIK